MSCVAIRRVSKTTDALPLDGLALARLTPSISWSRVSTHRASLSEPFTWGSLIRSRPSRTRRDVAASLITRLHRASLCGPFTPGSLIRSRPSRTWGNVDASLIVRLPFSFCPIVLPHSFRLPTRSRKGCGSYDYGSSVLIFHDGHSGYAGIWTVPADPVPPPP